MEKKKLKLTITGKPKKSFRNLETSKSQGKNSIVINKTDNKFVKKGSSFRLSKPRFSTKLQINPNDFEKENLQSRELQKGFKMTQFQKIKKLNQV